MVLRKIWSLLKTSVNQSVNKLKSERQDMLKEARSHYNKIIARANDFLEKTNREIHGTSERHLKVQLQHETQIENLTFKLDKKLLQERHLARTT